MLARPEPKQVLVSFLTKWLHIVLEMYFDLILSPKVI